MKTCWLHQQGNKDCLLFFAGWGMCPEPFYALPAGSFDVLMVYDYQSLESSKCIALLDNIKKKKSYSNIHLLAWSMGVWVAAYLFGAKKLSAPCFTSAIAMGGTCTPIHDQFGIPEQNFSNMAKQLSSASVQAFQRSMFADDHEATRFAAAFQKGKRSCTAMHHELCTLATATAAQPSVPDIYTSKIVTGRDRIFPARNQIRAWGRKECQKLSLPHFPFYQWSSWAIMMKELKDEPEPAS
ncbi:MAG: DUF452 family protein [Candidatus Electrothrix sp. MAN1_4]|nr:DUF452 family protein [Candidatus Electrothrix sp. MAN1_4]